MSKMKQTIDDRKSRFERAEPGAFLMNAKTRTVCRVVTRSRDKDEITIEPAKLQIPGLQLSTRPRSSTVSHQQLLTRMEFMIAADEADLVALARQIGAYTEPVRPEPAQPTLADDALADILADKIVARLETRLEAAIRRVFDSL